MPRGEDYKLSHKGMQIASQTLREARRVAGRFKSYLRRPVPPPPSILGLAISPNNREGPESSHCIHLQSMALPPRTL